MSIHPAVVVSTLALATACAHHAQPLTYGEVFDLGEREAWSSEEFPTYRFPGVRVSTLQGAPEADAVAQALDALTASCDGLEERVLWLECSESPCHVYVWGVPLHPGEDWAELTCQDAAAPALHGTFVGTHASGGLQMIATGVYAVDLEAQPAAELDEPTLARMRAAGQRADLTDTVLSEAAALHGYTFQAPDEG